MSNRHDYPREYWDERDWADEARARTEAREERAHADMHRLREIRPLAEPPRPKWNPAWQLHWKPRRADDPRRKDVDDVLTHFGVRPREGGSVF